MVMAKKKDISTIENVDIKQPIKADVRNYIKNEVQVFRIRQNIAQFKMALNQAESIRYPQRYNLYRIYNESVLDSHLSAAIQQRKHLTLCKDFEVLDSNGEVNEDKTKQLNKKWFRDYLDLALDSIFWGHSLIQFDSIIEDEFKCVDLIPRIYVKPEFHIVTENYSDLTGEDYLELPYKNWLIGAGKPRDLGLLSKVAALVIWKRNALGAWAEFIEVFGNPLRIGKTDVRDAVTRNNMADMLKNMSVAAYGVFDRDDDIELKESSKQDAFNVFDMMIQRCNSEISKAILGQTATMDEKSFVGSAEVQERVLEKVAYSDEALIAGINNYQLIPMLNSLGLGFDGMTIKVKQNDELDLIQKSVIDIALINSGKYKLEPEYLLKKYGTEVEEVEIEEMNTTDKVAKKIKNTYS
jgi:phage gp29-like protein